MNISKIRRFLRIRFSGGGKASWPVRDPWAVQRDTKGSVMIMAVAGLVVLAIMIPLLVSLIQREGKWSLKHKQSASAFHLGEAGIDRGIWKLTESDQNWSDAIDGTVLDGFTNDVTYTDVDGGTYKIQISSGPLTGQVTVLAKGRDDSTKEIRAVEAIYTKSIFDSGLQVDGGIEYKPGLEIHWGPVISFTSINQSPSDFFPRKFSKGQIVGRDITNNAVNTDDVEYWAFQTSLGDPPDIDLNYYKTQAENSVIPLISVNPDGRIEKNIGGNNAAVADPPGSGFFKASDNGNSGLRFEKDPGPPPVGYQFISTTSVIYIDNDTAGSIITDLQNGGAFLHVEALILAGANHNMDLNADIGVMGATIPVNAQEEYLHAGAAATWTADFAGIGAGNCCYPLTSVAVHGFIYVGGNLPNAGAGVEIVGAINVVGTVSVNTLKIYYDDDVVGNVKIVGGTPRRVSWRELNVAW